MSSGTGPDNTTPEPSGEDPHPQVSSMRRVQTREMINIAEALKAAAAHASTAPKVPPAPSSPVQLANTSPLKRKAPRGSNTPRPTSAAQVAINAKTGQVGVSATGAIALPPRANPAARRMIARFLS
ncbi:MAG: threonine/serine exporter family protein, partial [Paeniglutamicibacter terrestris]